MQFFIWKW